MLILIVLSVGGVLGGLFVILSGRGCMSRKKKARSWLQDPLWRPHGFACYDSEWATYQEAARLAGARSVNGWIRQWLAEAVLFERANARDREDLDGG